jgi:RNA polymerase sigma-70 factor (ECF subfamily)
MATMERQTQQIWTEFGDRLRAFVASRVENEADAEDIVQDVFLRIHARLDSLTDERRLTSWVYQITRNAIVDHYRERRPTTALPDAIAAETPPDDVAKELLPCLGPLLQRLPAQDREALILTEVEGLTQRELADRLGLSLSGAKSRVQRARQKLKLAFMGCCRFEFDRLGGVAEYHPAGDTCRRDRCGCVDRALGPSVVERALTPNA